MSSSEHPLAALVGPIRYARAKDFANLKGVQGLSALLVVAARRAHSAGLSVEFLKPLLEESKRIDAPELSSRRMSVERVWAILVKSGAVAEPEFSLSSPELPRVPPPSRSASPKPARVPAVLPPPPVAAAPARPKPARAPKEKVETPVELDDGGPARVLSISPRSGPLAGDVTKVAGRTNPKLIEALQKKNLLRVGDLLFLLPRIYEDRRKLKRIAQLESGERSTFVATVESVDESRRGGFKKMFRAVLRDETGSIAATHFKVWPWLKARYPVGKRLVVSGEVRKSNRGWEIAHPEIEPADDTSDNSVHFGRIVPVYSGFERYEQRSLRSLTFKLLQKFESAIEDPLPRPMLERQSLLPLGEAVHRVHFPPDREDVATLDAHQSAGHRRLAYDEFFFMQLGLAARRAGVQVLPGTAFSISDDAVANATRLVPFQLTGAQRRVLGEIVGDMRRPEPMNRLLQGDVGAGKTAVAAIASALALENGFQVALMAPTEILCEQHFRTFKQLLEPRGIAVQLLTGGQKSAARKATLADIASGKAQVVVGTHALIEEGVEFARLGLVIVDEQHRFGVLQRHTLMSKGVRPDVLVMTATPIPRTLAMTVYGDLDVSVIDELPPGRTPIETRLFNEKGRPRAMERVRTELAQGRQVFVVFPLIEESEKVDTGNATEGAARLQAEMPDVTVGLLHGRMKAAEKAAVMEQFRTGKIRVLVSTTVVEVGVDIPNASVMLIESAERFGLSQLHQLRGRVGRGAAKSYCLLLAGYARSDLTKQRLKVMEESTDGFYIAEKDLELRGPGEFLGTRQSGVPELAVANLARDQAILSRAREEARAIIDADPTLERVEHQGLVRALEERWQGRLKLARVG